MNKKNTLIKSLTAPYTLTIEHKERNTKKLKNESTICEKNSINSKQTSKPSYTTTTATNNKPGN